MVVGTESREAGRARLRKYTTTETEQVEEVTLREERAVVDKETVAVEEVRIGKEQVTEHEQVSAEVRKEHVDVEGASPRTGGAPPLSGEVR